MLKLATAPALEPVLLPAAKLQIRVDGTDEDTLITQLITLARKEVERLSNRLLITQSWDYVLDAFPASPFDIPLGPLQSVTSITYTDSNGDDTVFSSSSYAVDTYSYKGRVALLDGVSWPGAALYPFNGFKVRFVGGFGDEAAAVPERYIQAMQLLIGHYYENREAIYTSVGGGAVELPMGVTRLLSDDIRRFG